MVFTDKNRTPPSSRSLLIPLEVGYSSSSLTNRPFKGLGSTVSSRSAVRDIFGRKRIFLCIFLLIKASGGCRFASLS